MGQQTSCKTLIGVRLTMHLVHPNLGLATITYSYMATLTISIDYSLTSLPATKFEYLGPHEEPERSAAVSGCQRGVLFFPDHKEVHLRLVSW